MTSAYIISEIMFTIKWLIILMIPITFIVGLGSVSAEGSDSSFLYPTNNFRTETIIGDKSREIILLSRQYRMKYFIFYYKWIPIKLWQGDHYIRYDKDTKKLRTTGHVRENDIYCKLECDLGKMWKLVDYKGASVTSFLSRENAKQFVISLLRSEERVGETLKIVKTSKKETFKTIKKERIIL